MKTELMNFRLRTMLTAVAIIAVLMTTVPPLYDWYTSVPLSTTVAAFNDFAADRNLHIQQAVSEEEIVSAINAQLPTL